MFSTNLNWYVHIDMYLNMQFEDLIKASLSQLFLLCTYYKHSYKVIFPKAAKNIKNVYGNNKFIKETPD